MSVCSSLTQIKRYMKTLHVRIHWLLVLAFLVLHATAAWGQESSFFLEDFDSVTPPALPFGWADVSAEWVTSSSVASSGSGGNNLTIAGSQSASVQTPSLNLTGLTSGTITYLARRTSTYPLDSLLVLASIDGGGAFSVTLLDRGEALPATDGSYEVISMAVPPELLGASDVVLQFVALGGTTSGSNVRIDDLEILGEGDPSAGNSIFGFSSSESTLDQTSGLVEVPVFLDFENVEALQGIQVNMSWDVSELTISNLLPGTAVSNTVEWSLSYNDSGTELEVVLLGNDGASLNQGLYDPLFTIELSLAEPSPSLEALLTLNTVIGSLAVATGDDAGLILGQQTHRILLDPGDAVFSPDVTELDAGQVRVDNTAEATLSVSNTGNTDLVVSDVVSPSALFSVAPLSATISPGASEAFVVSFTPSNIEFGVQTATLTFQHNGQEGSTDIVVTAIGTGGRGDASEDGAVDILDLVAGIDYAIGVTVPDENQLASMDLFPFGASDGSLDVRDLTILSQAILAQVWPDDIPLPVAPPALSSGTNKSDEQSVYIQPSVSERGSTLRLAIEVPIRAVQLAISMDAPFEEPFVPVDAHPDLTINWLYDAWTGELRIVAVRMDGGFLDPGSYPLISLPGHTLHTDMVMNAGIAVVEGPERIALAWLDAKETELEDEEGFNEEWIGAPYPNPLVLSLGKDVHVPVSLSANRDVRAEVYDLLGRKVTVIQDHSFHRGNHLLSWNGQDHSGHPVAAGMYMLRVSTGTHTVTRTLVVR